MNAFKIIVGEYDDKTYYIVRGAKDAEEALSQVKAWYEENYSGGWPEWSSTLEGEEVTTELIELKKGVTRL